jgi:hypothetical protein
VSAVPVAIRSAIAVVSTTVLLTATISPTTVMLMTTAIIAVITTPAITVPARRIPVAMVVMTVTGVITTPLITVVVVRLGGGSVVAWRRGVITLLRHHIVASPIRVGRPVVVPIGVTIYGVNVIAVVAMVSIRYARSH